MAVAVLTPRNKTSNPELEPRLHRSQKERITMPVAAKTEKRPDTILPRNSDVHLQCSNEPLEPDSTSQRKRKRSQESNIQTTNPISP
jgi:hypothetical protein